MSASDDRSVAFVPPPPPPPRNVRRGRSCSCVLAAMVLATAVATVQSAEAPNDTARIGAAAAAASDTSEVDLEADAAADSSEIRPGNTAIDTTGFRPNAASPIADTTGFHVEIGATADFTN